MTSEQILTLLLETGRITQEDLDEVSQQDPLGYVATDLAHSLLCCAEHSRECKYYDEIGKTNVWSRPAHAKWKSYLDQFMIVCGIKTYEDVVMALHDYSKLQLHQDVLCLIVAQAIGIENVNADYSARLATFVGALDEPSNVLGLAPSPPSDPADES